MKPHLGPLLGFIFDLFINEFTAILRGRIGFDGGKEAVVACRGPVCSLNRRELKTNADDYSYAVAA